VRFRKPSASTGLLGRFNMMAVSLRSSSHDHLLIEETERDGVEWKCYWISNVPWLQTFIPVWHYNSKIAVFLKLKDLAADCTAKSWNVFLQGNQPYIGRSLSSRSHSWCLILIAVLLPLPLVTPQKLQWLLHLGENLPTCQQNLKLHRVCSW